MASSSVARTRTWTRPAPTLSHPLVYLSFSHDASCVIAADASTVQWLSCGTFSLRGLYQEKRGASTRAIVAACGDMLDEKASTCAVVTTTRVAADRPASSDTETTTFAVRRWRPGHLNYHWRYGEWAADIEAAADVRDVRVHGDKTFLVHDGRVDVYGPGGNGAMHVLHRVETQPGGGRPLCAASASRDAPLAFACAGAEAGEVRVERWAAAAGGFAPLVLPCAFVTAWVLGRVLGRPVRCHGQLQGHHRARLPRRRWHVASRGQIVS